MSNNTPATELYLITPETIDLDNFAAALKDVMAEATISCLQIRLPGYKAKKLQEAVETLAPIAWDQEAAVLLNDETELVKKWDLDGVHLETDVSAKKVKATRKLLGNDRSIGVSCLNSRHDAMLFGEAGADYVSFGPLFHSPTKDLPAEENVAESLRWWSIMMELPCVAVGGITVENVDTALSTGAEFIAPLSGIWQHPDGPKAAVQAFQEKITAHQS